MSKRKILALLLAVAMICSLCVSPALAAEDAGEPVAISDTVAPTFNDVEGHWAKNAIYRWAEAGIVQGDGDGSVNPGRNLRRCELASLLTRLLGLKATAPASTFSDVPANAWYKDAVLKCAAAGIMLGDGSGKANPEASIDRQQTIVMVARALGVKPSNSNSLDHFQDGEAVADWAAPYMATLTDMGILNGLPSGDGFVIAPADAINRASTFALLDKAIGQYITAPCEVTFNDPDKFIVVNSAAEEAGIVAITGATAGVVIGAGTTDEVVLNRAAVGTLKVDAPVDVTIGSGSTVTDLDANAAADVTNNGKVTNLNTNADDVTFDGNKPAAVNTAEDVEPAKDSKGKEVTPAASATTGGGSSTSKSADVVAAPIVDQAAENAIDSKDLGTVTVKGTQNGTRDGAPLYKVTITGKNIMNHTNAEGNEGHWVGFGMPVAPEGKTYTYEVNGTVNANIATRTCEEKGNTYNTAYFSAGTEEEFNDNTNPVIITVKDGEDLVATYEVSFNVTFYKVANAVKISNVVPQDHEDYAGVQNALISQATVNGLNMTLQGQIDPAKLVSGMYSYYYLTVSDEKIVALGNTASAAGGFDAAVEGGLVVATRVLKDGELRVVKHIYTAKDAAGHVQDTFTVTVDATGCTVKGMSKVTFKDAENKILAVKVVNSGDTVTAAPAKPAHTDKFYYTGEWVNAAGEVVDLDTFTVDDDDVVLTARKVDVVNTTLSVREDGPEGNHLPEDPNFHYEEVYGEAGLTMNGSKITVNATKLIAMVNSETPATAAKLAHIKGNNSLANAVVFGVAYQTPAKAKKVTFAGTLAGLDSMTADSDYRVLATHPTCYNNTLISYIPVASIGEGKVVTFDTRGDSDFCKWVDDEGSIVAVTKTVIEVVTEKMPQMTVTFKNGDETAATVPVDYNTAMPTEKIPPVPSKAGYTAAWGTIPAKVLEDTTVAAVFTPIEYTLKVGETAQSEKYTVEGDGIKLDELDAPKAGWNVVGWMCGEEALEGDIPANKLPDYADTDNTITLTPVYECFAEVSILEDTSAFDWAGYPAGGFGTPEMDEDYVVTGDLLLVEGFTGFNPVVVREQSGYYVAIEIKAPTGTGIDSTVPVIRVENNFAANTVKLHTLSDDALWLLIHVADAPADGEEAQVGATEITISVNWDGVMLDGKVAPGSFVCTLDFSGVTLKGADATEEP